MALIEEKKDSSGKNIDFLYCTFCNSKILSPGVGTFVNIEFAMPEVLCKKGCEESNREPISEYWKVEDQFQFDNIGFSNTVENIKYLVCADCNAGPVGWQDLRTHNSYIALSRVKNGNPSLQEK